MVLSGARLRPTVMAVTFTPMGVAGAGAAGGGEGFEEQAVRTARATRSQEPFKALRYFGAISSSSNVRDLQLLAGVDEVRVLDDVLVGVEDLRPLVRIAVLALRDLGKTVARGDDVGPLLGRGRRRAARGRRRRGTAALDVREIRARLVLGRVIEVSHESSSFDRTGG